ncbi:MAG: S8 family serine peptidase [Anaerolineae bacterium]
MVSKKLVRFALVAFFLLTAALPVRGLGSTLLSEGFDDITLLPGWVMLNNSAPLGSTGWFQGNTTKFSAQSGAANSYIAANYNNTAGSGTISNWLLTPELQLTNGATLRFWTSTASNQYPDRLQVRLSLAGASTNVGATSESVGDFTTLVLDINPTLAPNGYPMTWTLYEVTLNSLPAGATGRIAFRYYVEGGGPDGTNSDYIGIDSVQFSQALYFIRVPFTASSLTPPVLYAVQNQSQAGSYTVAWSNKMVDSYVLQEASDPAFSLNVSTVCSSAALSCDVAGKTAGTWYYRVKGIAGGQESVWSNVVASVVCGSGVPYNETLLYNMQRIQLPQGWACTSGGAGVVIAVLDTGVNSSHPELAGRLVAGTFYTGTSSEDDNGHGTHVAGIAAAAANNGGMFGVAPRASIMPVKVLDSTGFGYYSYIANGIVWAVDHGAQVINMSLGGTGLDAGIQSAVNYAYSHNVPVIVSAGNCGDSSYSYNGCSVQNQISYPAAFTATLAVAATDAADARASFSTVANYVDISAPGVSIWSASLGTSYAYHSGTSQAAPHVTGLTALIRALRPSWTVAQVYAYLESTATDINTAGWDNQTGWGRINVVTAMNGLTSMGLEPRIYTKAASPAVQQDPSEYRPGAVMFKLRAGAAVESVTGLAEIQAAGLQAVPAIEALGLLELQVPAGEETQWLAYLRSLPEVEYAELDGVVHIQ